MVTEPTTLEEALRLLQERDATIAVMRDRLLAIVVRVNRALELPCLSRDPVSGLQCERKIGHAGPCGADGAGYEPTEEVDDDA